MRIRIESTGEQTQYKGQSVRLWEGHTEGGVPVLAFVTLVACPTAEHVTRFKAEAKATPHVERAKGSPTLFDLDGQWLIR